MASLEEYAAEHIEDVKSDFENVVGQDSLTRFDSPKRKIKRKPTKSKTKKPAQPQLITDQPISQAKPVEKTGQKKRRKPNPKKSNPNDVK